MTDAPLDVLVNHQHELRRTLKSKASYAGQLCDQLNELENEMAEISGRLQVYNEVINHLENALNLKSTNQEEDDDE